MFNKTNMENHTSASNLLTKSNRKADIANYNLDHLYCHTNNDNSNSNNYIRSNSGSTSDMVAVLKEIKQLKAMLLLHLDLIQEQSDQLMSKDKQLATLKKENEMLRTRVDRFDRRYSSVATTNNKLAQNKTEIPPARMIATNSGSEENSLSSDLPEIKAKCDILKKFSTKLLNNCTLKLSSLSETIESKYKICDFDDQDQQIVAVSTPPIPATVAALTSDTKKSSIQNTTANTETSSSAKTPTNADNSSIIGERDGKYISKIILQRVQQAAAASANSSISIKTEDLDNDVTEIIDYVANINSSISVKSSSPDHEQALCDALVEIDNNIAKTPEAIDVEKFLDDEEVVHCEVGVSAKIEDTPVKSSVDSGKRRHHRGDANDTVVSPSRKRRRFANSERFGRSERVTRKEQQNALSNRPERHQQQQQQQQQQRGDQDVPTSDLIITTEHRASTSTTTVTNAVEEEDEDLYAESTSTKRSYNRRTFMTTTDMYMTREWQMDEIEAEVNKQIAHMGDRMADPNPANLEIPRWTIKECTGLYSIEGTEDLSKDVFMKRHARLEQDEKKRKKWDVQRIREQRTIERLKRRHCKNELLESSQKDSDDLGSFFPSAENIKYIQITDDLPVQAFGEAIPVIHSGDFALPWLHSSRSALVPNALAFIAGSGDGGASTSCSSNSGVGGARGTNIGSSIAECIIDPAITISTCSSTSTISTAISARTDKLPTQQQQQQQQHQQQQNQQLHKKHTSIVYAKKKCVRRHYTVSTSSTTPTKARGIKRTISRR